MGRTALGQERLEEAMAFYAEALEVHTEIGNMLGRAMTDAGIANVYRQQGRLDDAFFSHQDEELDNPLRQARDLETIAAVHLAEGERQAALDVLQKALATYRRAGVVSKRTQATERLIGQLRAAKGERVGVACAGTTSSMRVATVARPPDRICRSFRKSLATSGD
jgi:tetratricopeptide (TPR) repeat protein